MKLYWIKLPEHSDITTEGYVGITNDFEYRMGQHKRLPNTKSKSHYTFARAITKYGWNTLEKIVISEFDSLEGALSEEKRLRPIGGIGWNTLAGGKNGSRHSEEVKQKISKSMRGVMNTHGFKNEKVVCPHCGKTGQSAAMQRWHFDRCKKK